MEKIKSQIDTSIKSLSQQCHNGYDARYPYDNPVIVRLHSTRRVMNTPNCTVCSFRFLIFAIYKYMPKKRQNLAKQKISLYNTKIGLQNFFQNSQHTKKNCQKQKVCLLCQILVEIICLLIVFQDAYVSTNVERCQWHLIVLCIFYDLRGVCKVCLDQGWKNHFFCFNYSIANTITN